MRATLAHLQVTPRGQFWFYVLTWAGEMQKMRGLFGLVRLFEKIDEDGFEPDTSTYLWRVHLLGRDFVVSKQRRDNTKD